VKLEKPSNVEELAKGWLFNVCFKNFDIVELKNMIVDGCKSNQHLEAWVASNVFNAWRWYTKLYTFMSIHNFHESNFICLKF
jgi:hypothetical protein